MNAPIRHDAIEAAATAASLPRFIHLRVRSSYSLLQGALPIGKLAKLADANGFPAIALTDQNNLFGILEFSNKLADTGIQPIAGITLSVDFQDEAVDPMTAAMRGTQPVQPSGDVALLAMGEAGYANLMKLASQAFFDVREIDPPHVRLDRLRAHAEGLIVLTGGPEGPVNRALAGNKSALAATRLDTLAAIFGDRLYVELQRHGMPAERQAENALIDLAYEKSLPLVASNDCHFATPADYEAHDALLCIAGGNYVIEDDRKRLTPEHGLKSSDDMAALFADLPEALENTVEIARRCAYRPLGRPPILPRFVSAGDGASADEQVQAEAEELARQAREGLAQRLDANGLADGFTRQDYDERLEFELGIITRMKFPGYFLIVADFIKWSKAQGIPVGPGRGSGAGSVVAWALTITDLDP